MLHNITVVTLNYYIPDRWEMQEEMRNFFILFRTGERFYNCCRNCGFAML
ncbi:hypothetical protein CLOSYM_00486 [[Clostridium] symbiosum ATCC 14940]|uniref:Uncharacterized protein n=1 Tax=[Clostridium] symbiosum ATCC 14940 TaxID=411472 RepID=A0ABC9U306_CLOSY|nr:hypothetical protein CLOSYM_00486 [[Clostridium] symbiosum ATCC 14940]